jgi:hypothetical protein
MNGVAKIISGSNEANGRKSQTQRGESESEEAKRQYGEIVIIEKA